MEDARLAPRCATLGALYALQGFTAKFTAKINCSRSACKYFYCGLTLSTCLDIPDTVINHLGRATRLFT